MENTFSGDGDSTPEIQELLIAVDMNGFGWVIAHIGKDSGEMIREEGTGCENLGFAEQDIPQGPGIYCWEGIIKTDVHETPDSPEGPAEYDVSSEWSGTWRTAKKEDLIKFKVRIEGI